MFFFSFSVGATDSYGSPQAPAQDSYGSPVASAIDSYGSPKAPSIDSYGSPVAAPVSDSYGSPIGPVENTYQPEPTSAPVTQPPDFVSPEPQYGFTPCPGCAPAPTTTTSSPLEEEGYGSPQADPVGDNSYGSPQGDPVGSDDYGSPAGDPVQEIPRDVDGGLFTPINGQEGTEETFSPVQPGSIAPVPGLDIDLPAIAPAYDPSSPTDISNSEVEEFAGTSAADRPTSTRANDSPVDTTATENERPLAEPMDLEAYTASQDNSGAKAFDKQAVPPPALPLTEDGVTVDIIVENNLPNLPVANQPSQVGPQPQARQVLPTYSFDDVLPTYNNPANSLPTYNPSNNNRPTINNNPRPLPYNPQGVYDPFIFQEKNKPEEPAVSTQPPPTQPTQQTTRPPTQAPTRPTQQPTQPPRPAEPSGPGVTPGGDVNNDVELINIPEFAAPVSANQQSGRPGNSFSFTQFGNSPGFGFGSNINNNQISPVGSGEFVDNSFNSFEQSSESLSNQDPELFNPFGVSFASGFGKSTTRKTTQRTTTTTTTATTTRSTTTRRTTRRPPPQQTFQQQNQSPGGGFNFNNAVNNRPLPPTFAPSVLTFKPFGTPTSNQFGQNSLIELGGTPQPGRPIFSLGFQTTPAPTGPQFSTAQPSFFAGSTTQAPFFGGTITPQQFSPPTTTRRTTARTTTPRTRRTTRRPVLANQILGQGQGINGVNIGTSSAFGRPANLQIGSLDEITGDSGIFFSTPATTFVTPDDFGTPAPGRNRQRSTTTTTTTQSPQQGVNANQVLFSTLRPNRFSNQVLSPSTTRRPTFSQVTTIVPTTSRPTRTTDRPRRPTPVVGLVVPGLLGEKKPVFGNSNQPIQSTTFGGTLQPFVGFGGTPQPSRNSIFSGSPKPFSGPIGNLQEQFRQGNQQVSPSFVPFSNPLRTQSSETDRFIDTATTRTSASQRSPRDPKSAELEGGGTGVAAFSRRNMLMNIILRPGGGEQAKALPRPKVEVSSEGSNVILVRLTFPDNENIHGLRAFTPTDPRELQQFDDLRKNIEPGNVNIERLHAVSSEESGEDDFVETRTIPESLSKAKPTRPTRPPKKQSLKQPSTGYLPPPRTKPHFEKLAKSYLPPSPEQPSHSYLPPPEAPIPDTKPSLSYLPPPPPKAKSPSNQVNVFTLPQEEKAVSTTHSSFFKLKPTSHEEREQIKRSKIKPRRTHGPPPERPRYFYPIMEPFHPYEAMATDKKARRKDQIVEDASVEETKQKLSPKVCQ